MEDQNAATKLLEEFGPPWFPTRINLANGPMGTDVETVTIPGASMRDVFALAALQGMLASGLWATIDRPALASDAYGFAESMMQERLRGQ
jgi:hypothetical protein